MQVEVLSASLGIQFPVICAFWAPTLQPLQVEVFNPGLGIPFLVALVFCLFCPPFPSSAVEVFNSDLEIYFPPLPSRSSILAWGSISPLLAWGSISPLLAWGSISPSWLGDPSPPPAR
ncbi:hypothetical protein EJ08DRAFT_703784 [Tothia fuscella]|uniref:Uncharacterized protein n=1 Tax=Tothia fuscella TaxID=1048955 RepID=A0A9P4NDY5_9PEZI|nr:hypothetical protein EJ08DRAFT_703784 [Tothia fuscella]